jgi:hypothetical protein
MVPKAAWENLQSAIEKYVDSSDENAEILRKIILLKINRLIKIYPNSIDLIATKSDYLKKPAQREGCLLKAYFMAERCADFKNMTLISSSLAVFYVEDLNNYDEGDVWVSRLRNNLLHYFDEDEKKALKELEIFLSKCPKPYPVMSKRPG